MWYRLFHAQCLIQGILNFTTDQQLGNFVIIAGGKYPVGKKNINEIVLGIHPYAGPGKTSMTKSGWRGKQGRIRIFAQLVILLRFIKAQAATTDLTVIGRK